MTAPRSRSRQPKQLDAGMFQAEISSFRLHLAAEGKSANTVRTYTEAVQWFVATYLLEESTTWYGTAAGHAVAARGGFRDAGPVNREPTARPQVAAGIPALQGGGGCQDETAVERGDQRRGLGRLETWAGASVVGVPWLHDASATAIAVNGSRPARARTAAARDLRIPMWHRMLGHDEGIVKGAPRPPIFTGSGTRPVITAGRLNEQGGGELPGLIGREPSPGAVLGI